MAHGVSTDKNKGSSMFHIEKMTADATLGVKNVVSQLIVAWEGEAPAQHRVFDFFGTTVPDNTDYPDSIAPIGSSYKRFVITSGAVAGFMLYYKTSAGTWAEVGDIT